MAATSGNYTVYEALELHQAYQLVPTTAMPPARAALYTVTRYRPAGAVNGECLVAGWVSFVGGVGRFFSNGRASTCSVRELTQFTGDHRKLGLATRLVRRASDLAGGSVTV